MYPLPTGQQVAPTARNIPGIPLQLSAQLQHAPPSQLSPMSSTAASASGPTRQEMLLPPHQWSAAQLASLSTVHSSFQSRPSQPPAQSRPEPTPAPKRAKKSASDGPTLKPNTMAPECFEVIAVDKRASVQQHELAFNLQLNTQGNGPKRIAIKCDCVFYTSYAKHQRLPCSPTAAIMSMIALLGACGGGILPAQRTLVDGALSVLMRTFQ